jgi:hypothetical protein
MYATPAASNAEKAGEMNKGAKDKAENLWEATKDTASDAKEAIVDTAQAGKDKVKNLGGATKEMLTDAKDAVVDTAEVSYISDTEVYFLLINYLLAHFLPSSPSLPPFLPFRAPSTRSRTAMRR